MRSHGLIKNSNSLNYWNNQLNDIGFNYRLTDFQSALGNSQLKKLGCL